MATDLKKTVQALVSKLANDIVDAVRTARLSELGSMRETTNQKPTATIAIAKVAKAAPPAKAAKAAAKPAKAPKLAKPTTKAKKADPKPIVAMEPKPAKLSPARRAMMPAVWQQELALGLSQNSNNESSSSDEAPDSRVEVLPFVLGVAERFFVERAQRGATAPQLSDVLKAQGIATDAKEVTQALLERGVIKDAGFRRTTGKGTSPVFAIAS